MYHDVVLKPNLWSAKAVTRCCAGEIKHKNKGITCNKLTMLIIINYYKQIIEYYLHKGFSIYFLLAVSLVKVTEKHLYQLVQELLYSSQRPIWFLLRNSYCIQSCVKMNKKPVCCCMWSKRRSQSNFSSTSRFSAISDATKLMASFPTLVIRRTGIPFIWEKKKQRQGWVPE